MSDDILLEKKFRDIFNLLYNTNVPLPVLDKRVAPFLHEDIGFKDPWQEGRGKTQYLQGMRGFHSMFHFDSDLFQSAVTMENDSSQGRAIFDGVMNITPLPWLLPWIYHLRVLIVFHFDIIRIGISDDVEFVITDHEEIWSFGDMIEALPLIGTIYRKLFRRLFAQGFLLASQMATSFQNFWKTDVATGKNWKGIELRKRPSLNKPEARALENLW